MSSQFVLQWLVELPDDIFDRTDIISQLKAPRDNLDQLLEHNGIKFQAKSEIVESSAKPVSGAKRGRKPKLQSVPAEAAE